MEKYSESVVFLSNLASVITLVALPVGIFYLCFINIGVALIALIGFIFLMIFIIYSADQEILNDPVFVDSLITGMERDSYCDSPYVVWVSHTFEYKATTYTAKTLVSISWNEYKLQVGHTIPMIFLETDPNKMMLDNKVFARRQKKPKG